MVNYHNSVTIEREYSAYAFLPSIGGNCAIQPNLLVCPFNSGARESLARCGWYIHVSLPVLPCWPLLDCTQPWIRNPTSWEFLSTLDFEWDFIRRKRPYRRTIWVCSVLWGFLNAHSTTEDCY